MMIKSKNTLFDEIEIKTLLVRGGTRQMNKISRNKGWLEADEK